MLCAAAPAPKSCARAHLQPRGGAARGCKEAPSAKACSTRQQQRCAHRCGAGGTHRCGGSNGSWHHSGAQRLEVVRGGNAGTGVWTGLPPRTPAWQPSDHGGTHVFHHLGRYAQDVSGGSSEGRQHTDTCTKHQRSKRKFIPGIMLFWCMGCRKCVMFMPDAEFCILEVFQFPADAALATR